MSCSPAPAIPALAAPMRPTTLIAVDDYVLCTYSKMTGATGVKSMKLAEKVTGTLTGYVEGKSVVAGGTTYKINAVCRFQGYDRRLFDQCDEHHRRCLSRLLRRCCLC